MKNYLSVKKCLQLTSILLSSTSLTTSADSNEIIMQDSINNDSSIESTTLITELATNATPVVAENHIAGIKNKFISNELLTFSAILIFNNTNLHQQTTNNF